MPELPEVETMRRGIAPIIGSRITGAQRCRLRLRPIQITPRWPTFTNRLAGRTIRDVTRTGKRVVVEFDNEDRLIFEPRMTGLVLLAEPPDVEHLRLRIRLEGRGPREFMFWDRRGLGSVRLVRPREFDALYGDDRLGPDALQATPELLRTRLGKSRRAIKVALLDQQAIAGIGNLYASEILHVARLDPRRPCHELNTTAWRRLHEALLIVLEAAIQHEGSTLSDGTYRTALNQSGGYQNEHHVYDKVDELCATCGRGRIVRIVQAQRSTFYCPRCQTGRISGAKRPRKRHSAARREVCIAPELAF